MVFVDGQQLIIALHLTAPEPAALQLRLYGYAAPLHKRDAVYLGEGHIGLRSILIMDAQMVLGLANRDEAQQTINDYYRFLHLQPFSLWLQR